MVVAPEMTWLLVMTSPVSPMIIPVPWSSTGPPKTPSAPVPGPLASIDTTSGNTLFTMVGIWAPPARAGPGVSSPTRTAGGELELFPVPIASAIPAPVPPPMRAATTATRIHPVAPRGAERPPAPSAPGGDHAGTGDVGDPSHTGVGDVGDPGHIATEGAAAGGATSGPAP